jgi:hypothetical protein
VVVGVVVVMLATVAPAGAAPQHQWTRQFGTTNTDYGRSVAVDDTGVYVTGHTYGDLRGTNQGGLDVFVRKYNTDGRHQWTRQFGTTNTDYGRSVAVDDTGVYVTGTTLGDLRGTNRGGADVFVRKYNTDGRHQWTRQFGTTDTDYGRSVAVDDTGVYVTGHTYGDLRGTNQGGADVFVRKYNTDGRHQWTRQFGTTDNDYGFSVAVDNPGVYVTGHTYGDLRGTNLGGADVFVRKYNTDGRHQWTRQFGTTAYDIGISVAVDNTGVYVTGYTEGDLRGTNQGGADVFVRKYNTDSRHQWTRQFGTTDNDIGISVAVDGTGVYLTGQTSGDLRGTNQGFEDVFVRKYQDPPP